MREPPPLTYNRIVLLLTIGVVGYVFWGFNILRNVRSNPHSLFARSFGGPTLPCEWLILDWEKNIAYLKGTEPGEIIGPASFQL